MQRNKRQILKHICLVGLFFLLYTLGQTPGLLTFWGVKPELILPLLISVALLEGELAGALYGVLCGLLLDLSGYGLYGVNALLLLVVGCGCGLLGIYWLRATLKSALLLTGVAAAAVYLINYLLLYGMWGLDGRHLLLLRHTFPTIFYTTGCTVAVFPAVQWLRRHFAGQQPQE